MFTKFALRVVNVKLKKNNNIDLTSSFQNY